jgi:hypothetical protein
VIVHVSACECFVQVFAEEEKIIGLGTAGGHVQHEAEEIQMSLANLSGCKTLW